MGVTDTVLEAVRWPLVLAVIMSMTVELVGKQKKKEAQAKRTWAGLKFSQGHRGMIACSFLGLALIPFDH